MEKKGFWGTKAGRLTLAFLIIMAAFVVIMIGISAGSDVLCAIGFLVIAAAMLWSPIEVYILKKK